MKRTERFVRVNVGSLFHVGLLLQGESCEAHCALAPWRQTSRNLQMPIQRDISLPRHTQNNATMPSLPYSDTGQRSARNADGETVQWYVSLLHGAGQFRLLSCYVDRDTPCTSHGPWSHTPWRGMAQGGWKVYNVKAVSREHSITVTGFDSACSTQKPLLCPNSMICCDGLYSLATYYRTQLTLSWNVFTTAPQRLHFTSLGTVIGYD